MIKSSCNGLNISYPIIISLLVLLPLDRWNIVSGLSLFDIAIIISLVVIMLHVSMKHKFKIYWNSGLTFFFYSALFALLSFVVNFDAVSYQMMLRSLGSQWLFRLLALVVLIYLFMHQGSSVHRVMEVAGKVFSLVVVVGATIVLLKWDLDFYRNGIYWVSGVERRILDATVYSNPNVLSRFILITTPFIIYAYIKKPMVMGFLVSCSVLVLSSAASRTGIALYLILLTTIILSLLKRLPRISLYFIVFAFMSGALVVGDIMLDKLEAKKQQYLHYGTTMRIELARASFRMIKEKPLIGYGPGKTKSIINSDESLQDFVQKVENERIEIAPHNTFLMISVDSGLPSAIAFVSGFLVLIFSAWKKSMHDRDREKLIVQYLGMSVAMFFLSGFTAVNLSENVGWFAVALLVFALAGRGEEVIDADRRVPVYV